MLFMNISDSKTLLESAIFVLFNMYIMSGSTLYVNILSALFKAILESFEVSYCLELYFDFIF